MGKLRIDLKDKQARFFTTKNQLIKRALSEANKELLNEAVEGQTALLFMREEPVEGTKIVSKFIEENPSMEFKTGFLGERLLEKKDFDALASLPTRDELLAKTVMTIKGPIINTVFTLRGIINKFVLTMSAIKQKKEETQGIEEKQEGKEQPEDSGSFEITQEEGSKEGSQVQEQDKMEVKQEEIKEEEDKKEQNKEQDKEE